MNLTKISDRLHEWIYVLENVSEIAPTINYKRLEKCDTSCSRQRVLA